MELGKGISLHHQGSACAGVSSRLILDSRLLAIRIPIDDVVIYDLQGLKPCYQWLNNEQIWK
jgi:hypothetical protein